jgi:hypothetical protein
MKRLGVALTALAACAPAQPAATVSCGSLADCALGQVCEPSTSRCVDEPANRFVGKFQCTVFDKPGQAGQDLELAEVVGHVGADRFSLPGVFCLLDKKTLTLGFSDLVADDHLTVFLSAAEAASAHVDLKPFFDTGLDAASMESGSTFTAFGYSASGTVDLASPAAVGEALTGYVSIDVTPSAQADALFGAPCPNGRADCGRKTLDVGGVALCSDVKDGPMCSSVCKGSGDCALGNGVCVLGLCTKVCKSDRDCGAPLKCIAGDPGEGSGCF